MGQDSGLSPNSPKVSAMEHRCSICSEEWSDPRVLPCGHCFCLKCVQELQSTECPMDQHPIGDPELLPSNCSFLKIIADNQDTSTPKDIKCQNCDTGSATFWCEGCSGGTYYCEECSTAIHSAKAMSGHNRLTIREQIRTKPTFEICPTHNEEAKFYCSECAGFFCSVCVVDDHKLHTTCSIFKHAENLRAELKDTLNPIKENQGLLDQQHINIHEEMIKTKDQISLLQEELQKLKNQLAIQELKEHDMRDRQENVKIAYLFLSTSIQDVSIMDLVKKEHLALMKKQIEGVFEELYPNLNAGEKEQSSNRRDQSRLRRKSQNQMSREGLKVSLDKHAAREKRRSQKRQSTGSSGGHSSSSEKPSQVSIPITWNPFASSSSIAVSNDGKVAKKTSTCSYSSVVALQGWDSGVHRWLVWGTYTSCFDTVGVVTEDQNPDAPLRYGLGVYPGDHRKDTKITYTEKVVPANTVYRCTLDMEKHVLDIEFKLPENEVSTLYTIDISKAKGKLYPAVILCNSTSYTIENWEV